MDDKNTTAAQFRELCCIYQACYSSDFCDKRFETFLPRVRHRKGVFLKKFDLQNSYSKSPFCIDESIIEDVRFVSLASY